MYPHLCYMDIRDLEDCADALEKRLSARRRERLHAYKKREDRLRSLAAGLLAESFLAGPGFAEDSVLHGPHGKPFLPYGPSFNLSHSGNFVVFAMDTLPVGVDIQVWRPGKHEKLARACFHPEEIRQLEKTLCSDQAFFDFWVLKESYVKMSGCGVSKNFSSFCLRLLDGSAYLADRPNEAPFFKLYPFFPGYSLAVCGHHAAWPETLVRVDPKNMSHSRSARRSSIDP